MDILSWKEFKENVEAWAESRGVYEQKKIGEQVGTFFYGFGDLVFALDGEDRKLTVVTIGNIAACIVNIAKIGGAEISRSSINYGLTRDKDGLEWIVFAVLEGEFSEAICALENLASTNNLTFEACLFDAWEMMKDDNLGEE